MKKIIMILTIFSLVAWHSARPAEVKNGDIFRVYAATGKQVELLLSQDVEIVATNYSKYIDIRCSERQAQKIKSLGLSIDFLMNEQVAATKMVVPDGFHSYEETKVFLHGIASRFPNITRLDSIGASVESRGLWAIKISDNPETDEDEPCFLVEGCIHGNENHSLEICLFFIQYLVENYGSIPEVDYWIDNREIWVVPLLNPDGHERNVRQNVNNVDLNRNFGYWWSFTASNYGAAPFSEPETQAIRDLAATIKPYGSLAFHTSGRVILYPWAYISEPRSPDDALFIETAKQMIDSINVSEPSIQYSYRRSGSWYWHGGEHNDWMYSQHGMLSYTVELMTSQSAPPSDLENEAVLPAFRVMLRRPQKGGITGLITDATTGEPIAAQVKIMELFDKDQLQPRNSEPIYGRFIRFLVPGNYKIEVYKPGYRKEIRSLAVSPNDTMQVLNFQLAPDADIVYNSVTFDDDGGQSQGNGNGQLNPGETVAMEVFCKNQGVSKVAQVFAKLRTFSDCVDILSDSVLYGEVGAGEIALPGGHFLASIKENVLPGTKCKFHIDFYDSAGIHWESDFEQRIQGFFDDMEIEGMDQWTHGNAEDASNQQDDWQYGTPNGEGEDPRTAHSGNFAWGNDLGSGSYNGVYQNNVHNYLAMRRLNCSGWDQVYLQFYRWLNVASGDQAYISVNDKIVWENFNQLISERSWSYQVVDISANAANQDSVVIKFGLQTNSSGTAGGWTIDDVIVDHEITSNTPSRQVASLPKSFYLYPNYPNPFNSSTTIRFDLPESQHVTLAIYNIVGQKIMTLVSDDLPQGRYNFSWHGLNDSTIPVASGVYLVKLSNRENEINEKILFLK